MVPRLSIADDWSPLTTCSVINVDTFFPTASGIPLVSAFKSSALKSAVSSLRTLTNCHWLALGALYSPQSRSLVLHFLQFIADHVPSRTIQSLTLISPDDVCIQFRLLYMTDTTWDVVSSARSHRSLSSVSSSFRKSARHLSG